VLRGTDGRGRRRSWKGSETVSVLSVSSAVACVCSLAVPAIVQPSTPVAPLINAAAPPTSAQQRHFSSFPLTSHLHAPALRLVSTHPLLSTVFSFQRVPEIHDEFTYKVFIAKSSTVDDVISLVSTELGLTNALPVPGGGNLEYVIEEVWSDRSIESDFYSLTNSLIPLISLQRQPDCHLLSPCSRPYKLL
jgi:hypothetical protein